MYKDKDKQREATKDRVRRYRDKQKGVTMPEGVTSWKEREDRVGEDGWGGVTCPDIIDKLTDPIWRGKLEKICSAFAHRPHDMEACWLGDNNLSVVCDWLECTR